MRYYREVDASTYREAHRFKTRAESIDRIVALFAEDAAYCRQGFPAFSGREAIRGFFASARGLCGRHRIDAIDLREGVAPSFVPRVPHAHSGCTTLTVRGNFYGTLYERAAEDGREGRRIRSEELANLDFVDHWIVDAGGAVLYRQSNIEPVRRIVPRGMGFAERF